MIRTIHPRRLLKSADGAPLLVLMGLASLDGAGELAFCSKLEGAPSGLLVDMSKAWDPDGDGDLAARCPSCDQAHWTIPFVRYIQENDFSFEDGLVMIEPERLMAQTIENLRAKGAAKAARRGLETH
ncbi:MAG: hypothetical protein M3R34_03835 [Acidobacteriota bacterium]|nr:hypothetical protein [Acidobacteriota bacterium]